MFRVKQSFFFVLSILVFVLTAPVWLIKGYYELGCYVLEQFKIGMKGE